MPPASTYAVKLLMSRHRSPLLGVLTLLSACAGSSIDDGGSFSGGLFSGSAETGGSATAGTASATAGTAGTGATEGTEGMSSTSADASTTGSPSTTASSTDPSASSAVDSSGSDGSSGDPVQPFCGDGTIDPGEGCDDGNADDTDACLATCVAASCGDGFVQANVEACDDGVNDGSYGGCNPGCAQLGPFCGDAGVQAQEQCDPGVALPWVNVGCSAACVYDFSGITQLYCNGSCSWGGRRQLRPGRRRHLLPARDRRLDQHRELVPGGHRPRCPRLRVPVVRHQPRHHAGLRRERERVVPGQQHPGQPRRRRSDRQRGLHVARGRRALRWRSQAARGRSAP
ncbi:MAG: hypothetical protein IPK74_32215 [Deltaproteobacteria bacterium]|nr:hypothetical protein [Deltaproteobacteria bacterium]